MLRRAAVGNPRWETLNRTLEGGTIGKNRANMGPEGMHLLANFLDHIKIRFSLRLKIPRGDRANWIAERRERRKSTSTNTTGRRSLIAWGRV